MHKKLSDVVQYNANLKPDTKTANAPNPLPPLSPLVENVK